MTTDRSNDRANAAANPTANADATFDSVVLGGSDDDQPLELAELLNSALDKGVVVHGDVTLAVADIDLVKLNLGLLLSAFETVESRIARHDDDRGEGRPGGPAGSLARQFGPPNLFAPVSGAATAPDTVKKSALAAQGDTASSSPSAALGDVAQGLPERINADAPGVESGLARLVLTLIEVLRKVLEHQAIRRMDGGTLTPDEIERLGLALSRLHGRIQELKAVFGLADEDVQIDLGPLGRLR